MMSQAETIDSLIQYSLEKYPKVTQAVDFSLSWVATIAYVPAKIGWKYLTGKSYTSFELKNAAVATSGSILWWSGAISAAYTYIGHAKTDDVSIATKERTYTLSEHDLSLNIEVAPVNSLFVSTPIPDVTEQIADSYKANI